MRRDEWDELEFLSGGNMEVERFLLGEGDDTDAHPPLEPYGPEGPDARGDHMVVCDSCGDDIRLCNCGLTATDHTSDGEICEDCEAEARQHGC